MKTAHSLTAAALFGIALALACASAKAQQDTPTTETTDVPDAPYTRWLYGLDGSRLSNGGRGLTVSSSARFGSRADGMPYDHEISIQPDTRSVTVTHNETVKFVTLGGEEFRWKFDTPRTVVSLGSIAPPDVSLPAAVAVFVTGDSSRDRG